MKMPLFYSHAAASPALAGPALAALILLLATACHSRMTYPPGGYPYQKFLVYKDTGFYLYPLRNKLGRRDSFKHTFDSLVFNAVDEPNLSLRPQTSPIFRLWYSGHGEEGLIITLTPTELTIKIFDSLNRKYITDDTRLDSIERWNKQFIYQNFGCDYSGDTTIYAIYKRLYLDSIRKKNPQLADASYYWKLLRKEIMSDTGRFPHSTVKQSVLPADYQKFVDLLNSSGYWQMPYKRACNKSIADGPAYVQLEANTPEKYNFVSAYVCPDDTIDFYKACDQLVRLAGLGKVYKLLWIEGPLDTTHRTPAVVIKDVQLGDVREQPSIHKPHHPQKPQKN